MNDKHIKSFWMPCRARAGLFCLACALGLALTACDTDTWTPPAHSLPEFPEQEGMPNLVCFGNSLTAGYIENSEHGSFDDWAHAPPHFLAEKIKANVYNLGKSGDTSASGLDRIDEALKYKPNLVIIELGANDFLAPVFAAKEGANAANAKVPVAKTTENLRAIINHFNAIEPKPQIWVAKFYTSTVADAIKSIVTKPSSFWQTPPYTEEEFTQRMEEYNAMFTGLAGTGTDNNIEVIEDIWSGVWGVHMSGFIHPDAAGYKIMADNYFNAMKKYLNDEGLLK